MAAGVCGVPGVSAAGHAKVIKKGDGPVGEDHAV